MRVIRGFGLPGDSDVPAGESHDYATWDAAYVLGSLSPADRREYEAHLSVCPLCNQAVSELSGMPALLSKVDGGTVAVATIDPSSGSKIGAGAAVQRAFETSRNLQRLGAAALLADLL